MANTATAKTALPIQVCGVNVVPYVVSIDTVDTDLTVRTAANDKAMVAVVGIMFSEGTAANLGLKSDSGNTYVTLELAANQGLYLPLSGDVCFATQPGEDLIIRSSAAISSMLLYVIDTSKIVVR